MVIISYYYPGHINLFKYDSGLVDCPLWHWKVIPGHTKYAPASSLCWSPSLGKCKGWVRQSIQHDKKIYAKLNMKINFMCLCDWLLWPLTGRVERKRRYKPIKVAANHRSFGFWRPDAGIHVAFSARIFRCPNINTHDDISTHKITIRTMHVWSYW